MDVASKEMLNQKLALLVEDDPITHMLSERVFRKSAYFHTLKHVPNGEEALKYLDQLIEENAELPGFVLSDIQMPVMNGWEFLDELMTRQAYLNLKPRIWLYSSLNNPETQEKADEHPLVEQFIVKPLRLKELEFRYII